MSYKQNRKYSGGKAYFVRWSMYRFRNFKSLRYQIECKMMVLLLLLFFHAPFLSNKICWWHFLQFQSRELNQTSSWKCNCMLKMVKKANNVFFTAELFSNSIEVLFKCFCDCIICFIEFSSLQCISYIHSWCESILFSFAYFHFYFRLNGKWII